MKDRILSTLKQLEAQQGCRFLFAAESGSRAWGFASPDSDYDVRAIYVKPLEWYLAVEAAPKDTIEAMLPDELDISAWELRKALRLFAGCNLPLCEWLTSPVQYDAAPDFLAEMRALIPLHFNPVKATHHYLALAQQARATTDANETISIKKLFYLLRGILAARWCCQRQTMPPVLFTELLQDGILPNGLRAHVSELLEQKRGADEKARVEFSGDLRTFFDNGQQECPKQAAAIRHHAPPLENLDAVLRKWVRQSQIFSAPMS